MRQRKTYSGTFKAQVVLELLFGKKNLAELAAQYELHPNQIKNWKLIRGSGHANQLIFGRILKKLPCKIGLYRAF